MAGVRVPDAAAGVLPEFVRIFPGLTVLALDKLITQVGAVFGQIITASKYPPAEPGALFC